MKLSNKIKIFLLGGTIVLIVVLAIIYVGRKENGQSATSGLTPQSDSEPNNSLYYSRPEDEYLYRFDSNDHKLFRIDRANMKQSGRTEDFWLVEDIGVADESGKTVVRGTAKEGAVSQLYICDFSSECKAVDTSISQIQLTPDGKILAVKFENEEYRLGYYDPDSKKLDEILTLESEMFRVEPIDKEQAIVFAEPTFTDDNPLSILNLTSGEIIKQIDTASDFELSPARNLVFYQKTEENQLASYVYSFANSQRIKLNPKNNSGFFFTPKDDLHEIILGENIQVMRHNFAENQDTTEEIDTYEAPKGEQIAQILWIYADKYLIRYTGGQTQEINLEV